MNALRCLLTIGMLFMVLLFSSEGRAKTLCLKVPTDGFVDELDPAVASNRVQFGTPFSGRRYMFARGVWVRVTNNQTGIVDFNNYLDANGCTTFNSSGEFPAPSYSVRLYLKAQVATSGAPNYITVRRRNEPDTLGFYENIQLITTSLIGSGTATIYVTDEFILPRELVTLSYVMQDRFRGPLTGTYLEVHDWMAGDDYTPCIEEPPDSSACKSGGKYRLQLRRDAVADASVRAYLITHEYGHAILRMNGDQAGKDNIGSVTYNHVARGSCTGGDGHSFSSIEWDSAAATEGWAHYVATDVWTSHTSSAPNDPAWMARYYSSTPLNMEGASTSYPVRLCITNCGGCDIGASNETDWARQLWDFHTNSTPGSYQDHSAMLEAVYGSFPWFTSNTNDSVRAFLTSSQLPRWDALASNVNGNGIDEGNY